MATRPVRMLNARLGRRVRIWHHGGMVLVARSIGDEVHIRQNTTFGVVRRNQNEEIPVIDDRVDIGCGACILGNIRIGHDSVIGANAVVLTDVPPYSVVVSGTMPGKPLPNGQPGPNLYCAVIVKRVDEQTRSKTSINELLRD